MTRSDRYGTDAKSLPAALRRICVVEEDGVRRPGVRAVAGVRLLSAAEHEHAWARCVGRFPQRSDGSVDWDAVPEAVIESSAEDGTAEGDRLLAGTVLRWFPEGTPLVFWGAAAVPTAHIGAALLAAALPEAIARFADFWIADEEAGVLLERAFDGAVTVAALPPGPIC
ncbi:hypothetical protein [Nocardiopsis coralliicola]